MILCDVCENYLWSEPDEDNNWCADCLSPSVISVFMNFFRLKKCKYYREISYSKLLDRCKFCLRIIDNFSFHYRDKKHKKKIDRPYLRDFYLITRIKHYIEDYLDLRDYLYRKR